MFQMSAGQKYRRTEFDDDDNASNNDVTSPGVVYNPVIAFRAASQGSMGPGSRLCPQRTPIEKLLLLVVCVLLFVIFILSILLAAHRAPTNANGGVMTSQSRGISTSPMATIGASSQDVGWQGTLPASPSTTEGSNWPPASVSNRSLCTSKACITAASSILNSMDHSADPCHDFYQYACGGWVRSHPIPPGESRWDTYGVLRQKNQIVLKNLLDSELVDNNNKSSSSAEYKAAKYFASCLDSNKTLDRLGPKPIVDLLWDTFGGWTVTERKSRQPGSSFNESAWDFQRTLEQTHALGVYGFFNVWVAEDDKIPTNNILQLDQGGITLQAEQYINKTIKSDKVLLAYLNFMTEIVVLLGGDKNATEQAMLRVIELEQHIAMMSVPAAERRDVERMYNLKTLTDLQTLSPFMDWKQYFNRILSVTSYQVNETELILVKEPDYMRRLSELVGDMITSSQGKRTLHNYMMWHLIKTMVPHLSKPFQDSQKKFLHVLFGSSGEEEHWRYCISDTESVLGFAVGAMFVREAFDQNSKHAAEEMIEYIKNAFKKNIYKLDWMDSETRRAAVDKADAVSNKIGYPQYILNSTHLDDRYKELIIQEDDYFGNNLRAMRLTVKRNLQKLRKPSERNSWTMAPSTINAYYKPTRNEIVFLAGILQAPFFDVEYPKSLNYGAMGVVVGHELTHAFDDQGREYDKSGVLRPWWNEASVQRFKQQAKCIDDQYSAYSSFGQNLRGRQTLGENIADIGGLKSAFHAYTDWATKNNAAAERSLPGVNLTNEQLFFVAFAQVWCANSHVEDYHMAILADSHSLPMFRVRGPLSNSREFAAQFQCAVGSPMNPAKKCEVW